MKKAILKTFAATLSVSLMLSSCLGDSEGKIENANALAYIKNADSRNVAITNTVAFSHDYVNKLQYGEFYFLDYSVYTKDGQYPDGSYIARNVGPVGDGLPLVRGNYYTEMPQGDVDIHPSQMNVSIYSSYENDLDDNWVFIYECKVYAEDKELNVTTKKNNIRLVATLLEKDQYSGSGETINKLPENQAIVRLYIERDDKTRTVDKTKEKVAHKGIASINLRDLRLHFKRKMTLTAEGSAGIIQFKYLVEKNKEGDTEAKYIGSLSEERPDFYMLMVKD